MVLGGDSQQSLLRHSAGASEQESAGGGADRSAVAQAFGAVGRAEKGLVAGVAIAKGVDRICGNLWRVCRGRRTVER